MLHYNIIVVSKTTLVCNSKLSTVLIIHILNVVIKISLVKLLQCVTPCAAGTVCSWRSTQSLYMIITQHTSHWTVYLMCYKCNWIYTNNENFIEQLFLLWMWLAVSTLLDTCKGPSNERNSENSTFTHSNCNLVNVNEVTCLEIVLLS